MTRNFTLEPMPPYVFVKKVKDGEEKLPLFVSETKTGAKKVLVCEQGIRFKVNINEMASLII